MPHSALADCVFPEDIVLCILTRLPVKSIARFKSVCKPWLQLFSTREFVKMHHDQFSGDPKNQSFIVHIINVISSNNISLFNFESNGKKRPKIVNHPFRDVDVVGCCYGLCCITLPPSGQVIGLLNPAMNLFKSVSPSKVEDCCKKVSLGFGYDDVAADFKVVRIVYVEKQREGLRIDRVEVYSVNSDSWTTIDPGLQFVVFRNESFLVVNGNPYWLTVIDHDEVLVCFDVKKLVFRIVPLTIPCLIGKDAHFIDWNDSLGALVFTMGFENDDIECVDVWLFDDLERIWRKIRTFEPPVEVKSDRVLQCLKNGKIVVRRHDDDKLFVFDFETGRFKPLFYGARQQHSSFEMYAYSESLACIEGMGKVRARKRMRKMIDGASN